MSMTSKTFKWKPEVEFQHGDRLFSEPEIVISRPWIELRCWNLVLKQILTFLMSPKWKPEVDLRHCSRHLGNGYDVITRPRMVRFGSSWKFGTPTQNHTPMTKKPSKWKPEVEFQYSGRLFSETGNSNISAADRAILEKSGMQVVFDVSEQYVTKTATARRCRHLGDRHDVTTPSPIVYFG